MAVGGGVRTGARVHRARVRVAGTRHMEDRRAGGRFPSTDRGESQAFGGGGGDAGTTRASGVNPTCSATASVDMKRQRFSTS